MRKTPPLILTSLLLVLLTGCPAGHSDGQDIAAQEATKELVRHWIVSLWDNGDRDVFEELATEDYVYSSPGEADRKGDEAFAYGEAIRAAFPDLNNSIEEQYVDGDMIVTRGTTRGTHQGPFGDFPATGNAVEVPWVMFTRLRDGRVAADWEIFHTFAFMSQIGAVSTSE